MQNCIQTTTIWYVSYSRNCKPGSSLRQIKTPVALSSIMKKLDKGVYASVEDVEEDLEQMVKNAKIYNEEGSIVITDAMALLV